jgi:hypothetical protein
MESVSGIRIADGSADHRQRHARAAGTGTPPVVESAPSV